MPDEPEQPVKSELEPGAAEDAELEPMDAEHSEEFRGGREDAVRLRDMRRARERPPG